LSEEEVDMATIRAVCEKSESIPILRCFERTCEPLRPSEVSEISGVDYDTTFSILYRLADVGILRLQITPFDKRKRFFAVANETAVKQILQYFEKWRLREREFPRKTSETEEV
jgi:hypothetical protein